MRDDQLALLADCTLPPAAVIIGLRVSSMDETQSRALGGGEHELAADAVATWVQGYPTRNTVGGYLRALVLAGWLQPVKHGGGGRGATYRWAGHEKLAQYTMQDAPEHAQQVVQDAESCTMERASSPPLPSSPPTPSLPPTTTGGGASARAPVGLDDPNLSKLRGMLGEHAGIVDVFARSADHRHDWPLMVVLDFRPPGTNGEADGGGMYRSALDGVAPDRVGLVLARAMKDYASKGKPYDGRYFRGFVEGVADDERDDRSTQRSGGGQPRKQGRRWRNRSSDPPHERAPAGAREALDDAAELVS